MANDAADDSLYLGELEWTKPVPTPCSSPYDIAEYKDYMKRRYERQQQEVTATLSRTSGADDGKKVEMNESTTWSCSTGDDSKKTKISRRGKRSGSVGFGDNVGVGGGSSPSSGWRLKKSTSGGDRRKRRLSWRSNRSALKKEMDAMARAEDKKASSVAEIQSGTSTTWAKKSYNVLHKPTTAGGTPGVLSEIFTGELQLGKELGKGAFGTVHSAMDVRTGALYAVKIFELRKVDRETLDEILNEAKVLRQLVHDNIVTFYGYTKSDSNLYFILEWIEGGALTSMLKNFGKMPEDLVATITHQVLQGLQYLHDHDIIHRDIKGSNILMSKNGRIKLADFGTAANIHEKERKFDVVGTPYWMAPEVIEMTGHSNKADIWSVACTIHELMTLAPPYFEMATMSAIYAIVSRPRPPFPPGVSSNLQDFMAKCWIKDPPSGRPAASDLLKHPWILACILKEKSTDLIVNSLRPKRGGGDVREYFDTPLAYEGPPHKCSPPTEARDDLSPVSTTAPKQRIGQASSFTLPASIPAKPGEAAPEGGGEFSTAVADAQGCSRPLSSGLDAMGGDSLMRKENSRLSVLVEKMRKKVSDLNYDLSMELALKMRAVELMSRFVEAKGSAMDVGMFRDEMRDLLEDMQASESDDDGGGVLVF